MSHALAAPAAQTSPPVVTHVSHYRRRFAQDRIHAGSACMSSPPQCLLKSDRTHLCAGCLELSARRTRHLVCDLRRQHLSVSPHVDAELRTCRMRSEKTVANCTCAHLPKVDAAHEIHLHGRQRTAGSQNRIDAAVCRKAAKRTPAAHADAVSSSVSPCGSES